MLPVDHIGILGRDIKTMVNAYRELGFSVTEPERLSAGTGVEQGEQFSAHVMFNETYIELTAVENCQPEHHLAPYIGLPCGVRILILQCDDAASAHKRLASEGLPATPIYEAERQLSNGNQELARFRWFSLAPQPLSQLLIGWVQHLTKTAVFQGSEKHPNSATDMAGLQFYSCALPEDLTGTSGIPCFVIEQTSDSQVIHSVELWVDDLEACLDETGGVFDCSTGFVKVESAAALGVNLIFRNPQSDG